MGSVVAFLFFIDDHPVRASICDDIPVFDTCVEKGSLKTITALQRDDFYENSSLLQVEFSVNAIIA